MIGAVIALSSAFCFALSDVFVRRGVAKVPVAQAVGQWYTRSLVRGRANKHWFATLATIEEDAGVNVGSWPDEA